MTNCLFCYQPVLKGSYHDSCCNDFFGFNQLPMLDLGGSSVGDFGVRSVRGRIAVTGVQAKLPISLIDIKGEKKWRVLRPGGTYILKPPFEQYSFMPEVEDLTMHLARVFNIPTADHMLLETASGALAYLTRRFDRCEEQKIHAEDLC